MIQENRIGFVGKEVDRGNGGQCEAVAPDGYRPGGGTFQLEGDGEAVSFSPVLPLPQAAQVEEEEFAGKGEVFLEKTISGKGVGGIWKQ